MKRGLLIVTGLLLWTVGVEAQTRETMPVSSQQALVNRYCSGCHNDTSKAGGFSWTEIDLADPAKNAEQAEKVIRKLAAGVMPPAGSPRPDPAARRHLFLRCKRRLIARPRCKLLPEPQNSIV